MKTTTINNKLFQSVFDASVEGILVVDNSGNIIMANPSCEQMFGYEPETLAGKNIEILIPEKLKLQHREHAKKYIRTPKARAVSKNMDLLGIKKDGKTFRLDISLSPTIIDGKNATIAFLRNATRRKNTFTKIYEAKAALKETDRKFDTLINNLSGIVYRCKNNRNWEMEYISEGCQHITGYSSQEFLKGKVHFTSITLQDDQEQVWNNTQQALSLKKSYNLEYRIKSKDGQIKHLWEQGAGVFDANGELVALEGYIADVTSQKKTEQKLKANEAKIKALLGAIPDMMFIQDFKGNFLDFYSPDKVKLLIPVEEIIDKNMKDILPPKVFDRVRKAQERTIKDKHMQLVEYSLNIKNEIRYFEARIVPLNNHNLLTIVRDVTEVQAKDDLLKIRNNALASANNSIIITDAQQPDLPIIYCNDAFEKMTGYAKEDVMGRNCQFLQNDDRDQEEINIMKNAIANGEACNVILRNYKKDGEMFWNEVAITPIYNQAKELTHFIGVQNDVSHKIKEENLKDQIRKILELVTKDKSLQLIGNKIVETVEAYFKGCVASILLLDNEHKTLHKLAAPNLPKAFSEYIEGVTIGPKVGSCGTTAFLKKEVIVSNIDTNTLWEDYKEIALKNNLKACWSFPIISSKNQVLGTFAIYSKFSRKPLPKEKEMILDMTYLASVAIEKYKTTMALQESKRELEKYAQKLEEKIQERTQEVMATVKKLVESNLNLEDQIQLAKLAEKKALASEKLASATAQNFPNGFIAVVDKNFKVLFAEGEVLAQLGLKQIVFDGMTIDDVIDFSEERKSRIKDDILKTLSGEHLSFEIEYKNRYFSVNTAPMFDGEENATSALMVYNDISQQKKAEENIKNALAKERELNELKSRFVSMASHEFRTPLSAILTSAVLISKQNEPGKELKREKYVAQIEKNVKNLVVILNDFLSLSKLEEGKVMAAPEQFDLINFSKSVVKEMKLGLKEDQNITIKTTVDNLVVSQDSKLLRHVFTNLISNASKYSSQGKSIDFSISQDQENVLIHITDQGIGIPEEDQKYMFQRFYRAKNAANIEGTGLGLNITKHYVELMGGTIDFKSKLNKGTTFWVQLPIKR